MRFRQFGFNIRSGKSLVAQFGNLFQHGERRFGVDAASSDHFEINILRVTGKPVVDGRSCDAQRFGKFNDGIGFFLHESGSFQ